MDTMYHDGSYMSIVGQDRGIPKEETKDYASIPMDIAEIRRKNLNYLIQTEYDGIARQFGLDAGLDPSYVSRLFTDKPASRRTVGSKLARKIEIAIGKPKGWLDRPQWVTEQDNDTLLVNIIQAVENSTKDVELAPEKKAELIASLYNAISKKRPTS